MPGNLEFQVKELISRPDANPLPVSTEVISVSEDHDAEGGEVILVDASGGSVTITLPIPLEGTSVTVKKTDSSGNAVDMQTPNSENIDGGSNLSITSQYTSREIVADGDNYFIV